MTRKLHHYIGGTVVPGTSGRYGDVHDPSTGEVQAVVDLAGRDEVTQAIDIAEAAQPAWAATNAQRRARILGRFVDLVRADIDNLARLLSSEHGKVVADSRGDIERGLDVVEFAMGAPHLLKGEHSDGVGRGIDTYSLRRPLGVVAGITPFNFPAMIPLWKAGPALAAGNAFILKPSERDPGVPLRLAELWSEAGLPDGIFQVVNGDKEAVDALLEDPRVQAYGFVGSTPVARVRRYLDAGVAEGADLVVDGRDLVVPGHEGGYFIGPSLFDRVTRDMSIWTDEIFGPVLCIVRAADYEEALALPSDHRYGNGVAIMTGDGDAARDFAHRVNTGMVGINVPIPVPIGYYTFGGWKASGFGDLNQHGPDAFRFWTRTKTVTSRWPSGIRSGVSFAMPLGDQS